MLPLHGDMSQSLLYNVWRPLIVRYWDDSFSGHISTQNVFPSIVAPCLLFYRSYQIMATSCLQYSFIIILVPMGSILMMPFISYVNLSLLPGNLPEVYSSDDFKMLICLHQWAQMLSQTLLYFSLRLCIVEIYFLTWSKAICCLQ